MYGFSSKVAVGRSKGAAEGQQGEKMSWRWKLITLVALSFLACGGYLLEANDIDLLYMTRSAVCSHPVTPSTRATLEGRVDTDFPSPRCCEDEECLKRDKGRHAVLTTLRSDDYLPLLENLACSLQHSNSDVRLLVATVKGDLSAEVLQKAKAIPNVADIIFWDEYRIENTLRQRFALNWVKLRAWEMEEYDAILMIDTDTIVLRDISSLWSLQAHFATVLDQDKTTAIFNALGRQQGGVVFLRPCKAVATHMMHLVSTNTTLQFTQNHAEQSFLDWYFRFERWTLPIKYNAIGHLLRNHGDTTSSGTKPVIVHYSGAKPMILDPEAHHEQALATNCGFPRSGGAASVTAAKV
jgi:hypothetical protein